MTQPILPPPVWAAQILERLDRLPDITKLLQTLGAERQNTERVRHSREQVIKELQTVRREKMELQAKVAELEQIIISHLRKGEM